MPHCSIGAQRGRLRRQVNYVIHCAASIIFNEHVHTLLANNYQVRSGAVVTFCLTASSLSWTSPAWPQSKNSLELLGRLHEKAGMEY